MFYRVIAGVLSMLLLCTLALPAFADTPVSRIRVQVTGADGQPVDARIQVSRLGTFAGGPPAQELPEGPFATLSVQAFRAWTELTPERVENTTRYDLTADRDGNALQPGFYEITFSYNGANDTRLFGQKTVYIGPGASPTIILGQAEARPIVGMQLVADRAGAEIAVNERDLQNYQDYRASAEARLAEEIENLADLDAAIEAFRRDKAIPQFRNARDVRRAIDAARNTPGLPVDQTRIEALEAYENALRYREHQQRILGEARKIMKDFPEWPVAPVEPASAERKTSRLDAAPGAGQVGFAALPVSVRGGLNIGAAKVGAKGDLATTTGTGNVSGSDFVRDPFIGLRMTLMMNALAVQAANFGSITPILHFYAAQNLGGFSNIVDARLHPGTGNDTFVRFRRGFQAGAAIGFMMALNDFGLCGFGSPRGCMDFTLWAGPLLATMATRVITDESGGGGSFNSFTRNETLFGAMVGMQLSYLICATCQLPVYLTLGGQLNMTGNPDAVGGRTSPFNFDYRGGVNPGTEALLWLGVAFQLDQLFRSFAPR